MSWAQSEKDILLEKKIYKEKEFEHCQTGIIFYIVLLKRKWQYQSTQIKIRRAIQLFNTLPGAKFMNFPFSF